MKTGHYWKTVHGAHKVLASALLLALVAMTGIPVASAQEAAGSGDGTSRLTWVDEAVSIDATQFFSVKVTNYTLADGTESGASGELWAASSDGASRLMSAPRTINGNSSVAQLTVYAGKTYFLVSESEGNFHPYRALWVSDGTVEGTTRVNGFGEGQHFGDVQQLRVVGGSLLFFAEDSTAGTASLMTSDGTESGTSQLAPVSFGARNQPMVVSGGKAYFTGLQDGVLAAWVTDGTQSGTLKLAETANDDMWLNPTPQGVSIVDAAAGKLWTTDGTIAGTRVIWDAGSTLEHQMTDPFVAGGDLYFQTTKSTPDMESQRTTLSLADFPLGAPAVVMNGDPTEYGQISVQGEPNILVTAHDSSGAVLGSTTADADGFGTITLDPPAKIGDTISAVATAEGQTSAPAFYTFNQESGAAPTAHIAATPEGAVVTGTTNVQADGIEVYVKNAAGNILGQGIDDFNMTEYVASGREGKFAINLSPAPEPDEVLTVSYAGFQRHDRLWCSPGLTAQAIPFASVAGNDETVPGYLFRDVTMAGASALTIAYQKGGSPDQTTTLSRASCATGEVTPVNPPDASSFVRVQFSASIQGKAFFADFGQPGGTAKPYVFDGTEIASWPSTVNPIVQVADGAYSTAWLDSPAGKAMALQFLDGTVEGTRTVYEDDNPWRHNGTDLMLPSRGFDLGGNKALFTVASGEPVAPNGTMDSDIEVWLTDGTSAGTHKIANLLEDFEPAFSTAPNPTITGLPAQVGRTLTADPGVWEPAPGAVGYQWMRDGAAIAGATGATYPPSAADIGKALTVVVTASLEGYKTSSKTSAPTIAVAAGTLAAPTPTVSGTAKVGSKLTAVAGTWTSGTTLKYQWYRGATAISGATASNYTAVAADMGHKLKVTVAGSKSGYTTVSKSSAQTAAVAAGTLTAPVPKITGTAKVGSKLTAVAGTWTSGTTLKYQWYRGTTAISGATVSSYTAVAADKGQKLKVTVAGSKSGYTTVSKSSAQTAAVAAGTLTAPVPKITGTAKVGSKLTAVAGTWTSGTTLKYQWYRGTTAISGATASTYKLTAADRGKTIKVRVTGSKSGYNTVVKYSSNTVKVK